MNRTAPRLLVSGASLLALAMSVPHAQSPQPDLAAAEAEMLRHFQALVRMETSDPPGGEKLAGD